MDRVPAYEIKVLGKLDNGWAEWLGGMAISSENGPDGATTTLTASIADQAALRGILDRIWDLNLTLISLSLVKIDRQGQTVHRPKWDI